MLKIIKKKNFEKDLYKKKVLKPKILFEKKIYFIPALFGRNLQIPLDQNYNLLNNWYLDKQISSWTANKLLSISLFNFDISINIKLISKILKYIYSFKKIKIEDNEIIILGPWSDTYWHQIIDFILRIVPIVNNYKKFYLPKSVKKIISQNPYSKIFKNKINFYDDKEFIQFYNAKYLTIVPHYKKNQIYLNCINELKNKIKIKKNKLVKYSIISRNKTSRVLLNEKQLFKKLKKYGFKLYNFDNMSQIEQISVMKNSKIVIGYHGSNLTNILFMKKNSNIIEISNKYLQNPCYKILSNNIQNNYFNSITGKSYKNLDGICNIAEIEEIVKKIIFKNLKTNNHIK